MDPHVPCQHGECTCTSYVGYRLWTLRLEQLGDQLTLWFLLSCVDMYKHTVKEVLRHWMSLLIPTVYEPKGDHNPAGRRTCCGSARDTRAGDHTCLHPELSGKTLARVIRPTNNYYPVKYRRTYVRAGHMTIIPHHDRTPNLL